MTTTLVRRVAPVLLLLQVAYIGLFTVAVAVLPSDTGELDHTESTTVQTAFLAVAVLAAVVVLAGGAALLGLEKARTRTPRAVRTVWIAVVALIQLAIAVRALINAAGQTAGPDTVIGAGMVAFALLVAAACAVEVRGASALTRPNTHV